MAALLQVEATRYANLCRLTDIQFNERYRQLKPNCH